MELGTLGIWSMQLRDARRPEVHEAAAELDALGFGALWIPGLDGKGVFDDVAALLEAVPRASVALGVLGIWGQRPAEVGRTLAELDSAHGARTVLGLGVSSPESASAAGQDWGNPLDSMAGYLDELAVTWHPVARDRLLLGALGPRMARLAATRTAGLHRSSYPPSTRPSSEPSSAPRCWSRPTWRSCWTPTRRAPGTSRGPASASSSACPPTAPTSPDLASATTTWPTEAATA